MHMLQRLRNLVPSLWRHIGKVWIGSSRSETKAWNELLAKLKNKEIPTDQIGHTIVKLGKPFAQWKIQKAKTVVASYADHTDSRVRQEVLWFLTSWGKLREYEPLLIRALRHDSDEDNRNFAALFLAQLLRRSADREAIRALRQCVEDASEDRPVRLQAYASLLELVCGEIEHKFSSYEKELEDIDWNWVRSLGE